VDGQEGVLASYDRVVLGPLATAPTLTAGQTVASFAVIASVAGVSGPATFSLANLAGPGNKLAFAKVPALVVVGQSSTSRSMSRTD
jgi:hypothetical protein